MVTRLIVELSPVSMPRLGLIFAGLYALIALLALAFIIALDTFLGYAFNGNFLSVLVPMLAAMQVGTIWFNRTGARPASGQSWKAALIFTAITLAINIGVALLLFQLGFLPEVKDLWLYPDAVQIMTIVMAVISVLVLLACRIGFGLGARQAAKLKEKQDRKAA